MIKNTENGKESREKKIKRKNIFGSQKSFHHKPYTLAEILTMQLQRLV